MHTQLEREVFILRSNLSSPRNFHLVLRQERKNDTQYKLSSTIKSCLSLRLTLSRLPSFWNFQSVVSWAFSNDSSAFRQVWQHNLQVIYRTSWLDQQNPATRSFNRWHFKSVLKGRTCYRPRELWIWRSISSLEQK